MIDFTVKELAASCGGPVFCKEQALDRKITFLTTDTREVKPEEASLNRAKVFLALKGERFDGNDFVEDVCKAGVGAVVCNISKASAAREISEGTGAAVILVNDTLAALGDIAAAHREKFSVPVVAVTGSVGKTSTKEIVATVLAEKLKTLKTQANFNNEIGLPKTIFGLDETHEALVVEMGMRGLRQIEYLAKIAKPEVGIITNIGIAHMELLGSRENILRAKLEIGGARSCKTLILNGDDEYLSNRETVCKILEEYGNAPKIIYYGTSADCEFRAENIKSEGFGSEFTLVTPTSKCDVCVPIAGLHNVYNALAAAAAGFSCGLSLDEIKSGLAKVGQGKDGAIRQKIEVLESGITLIDDTYNAGPESMKASLSVLSGLKLGDGGRRVAILGDMLELGALSKEAHYGVGEAAASLGVMLLITVGELSKNMVQGYLANCEDGNSVSFKNSEEAAGAVADLIRKGDAVLVKGSHAMEMPKAVEALKKLNL